MRWIFILLLGILSSSFSVTEEKTGDINVVMTGFRNNEGFVWVILYNSEEGFLKQDNTGYRKAQGQILENKSSVVFEDIPFGEYAIAYMHDENNNKTMDLNKIMIPKEGFGVSNNPRIKIGPPKYEASKFKLSKKTKTVVIKTKYLI